MAHLNSLREDEEGNEQEEETIDKSCQHFCSHISTIQNCAVKLQKVIQFTVKFNLNYLVSWKKDISKQLFHKSTSSK